MISHFDLLLLSKWQRRSPETVIIRTILASRFLRGSPYKFVIDHCKLTKYLFDQPKGVYLLSRRVSRVDARISETGLPVGGMKESIVRRVNHQIPLREREPEIFKMY